MPTDTSQDPGRITVALTVEQLWQPVPGGSGSYIRELCRSLEARPDVRPTGLRARHGDQPADSWQLAPTLDVVASRLPRTVLYESWNRLRRPRTWRAIPSLDVVHATTWAVPPSGPPLVVTVHDLAFLRQPEHFSRRGNAFFRRALDLVRDEAAVVIAVSDTTRQDCVRAGIAESRIRVVHHGVDVPTVTGSEVAAFRARHGLQRPYLLWCGTLEPRKNLPGLLRAYAVALRDGLDLDLVLVGPTGWGDASAAVTAAVADLPPDRVHRLGSVDHGSLHAAYAGARAFCFPSHWEGFGMPVLEAMAHGVPVVTSAGTSMAEIATSGALLVDPSDEQALADAITAAATTEHDRLAREAHENASRFSWAACAEGTVAAYRDALRSR